jgi:hypothetical protein
LQNTTTHPAQYNAPVNQPADASDTVLVVTDGAAGNERQAAALAAALDLRMHAVRLHLRPPWAWFAPRLTLGARWAIVPPLAPPWPALAIGCGRQAALFTRLLRQASAGRTFVIQVLDPRIATTHFDLVVAPRHDRLAGSNVIQTLGALHPVDDAWLARGLADFSTLLQLPSPRWALLIGGPRRGLALSDAWFAELIARVGRQVATERGSLLIACSRRTPEHWRARLTGLLREGCTHRWFGPADGVNPYPGYLAVADRLVVTPDSVNMLSEACATGKPVFTLLPASARSRLCAFHAELRARGWLHALEDSVDPTRLPRPAPLRELAEVAARVRSTLAAARPELARRLRALPSS